jgi:site-specific recombinase XerD
MSTRKSRALAALSLNDAYDDFVLSRKAAQCSPATLEFYRYSAGKFVSWLKEQGLKVPEDVAARHVREYLSLLIGQGKSDNTIHDNARAIKTLMRFWHNENYTSAPVTFAMPKVAKKRLPCLSAEELGAVIRACTTVRDKAIILFMGDTGLRRSEVVALSWGDVNMTSGLVTVKRGKGGTARSTVVGAVARRELLAYRRTIMNTSDDAPLFQSKTGTRLTGGGLRLVYQRLSKLTGIAVSPHAMRRTFVILSLRGDMDVLHLQAMLGHSSLEMVRHYAQLMDEDLIREHKAHSPMDNLHRR